MIKKLRQHILLILSIIALASATSGAVAYFAPAKRVAMLEQRLDQKIVSDNVRSLQDQIFQIEREYSGKEDQMSMTTRDWLRRLKEALEVERLKYEGMLKGK